jgi:hypothetical protein
MGRAASRGTLPFGVRVLVWICALKFAQEARSPPLTTNASSRLQCQSGPRPCGLHAHTIGASLAGNEKHTSGVIPPRCRRAAVLPGMNPRPAAAALRLRESQVPKAGPGALAFAAMFSLEWRVREGIRRIAAGLRAGRLPSNL